MKIRNSINGNKERKVFIHENKREESVLVAIPSLNWSILFSYDEFGEGLADKMKKTLGQKADQEEAEELVQRILQWTREM
ncbi:YueH family protein [Jeotgalibacillus proteolyticus]|uniref:YueH-like family protein n=1 Tax=Jeotgalibacillus proteolyticus TaxID=2082395 RepID=A0A2S5GH22_9BACL|nr:YueH family protein [Jeotgalibacillus proteolyticus]PPA72258.1 hypothetical protein C4B60_02445 [Jeotgalibacillus proteolyticus]